MNLLDWPATDIRLLFAVVVGIVISWISEGVALCFIFLRQWLWERDSKRKGNLHGPE